MPKRDFIQREFDTYCAACFAGGLDHAQYLELRRAFFGGARSFLTATIRLLSPGTDVTDADVRVIASLDSELTEFLEAVKNGEK